MLHNKMTLHLSTIVVHLLCHYRKHLVFSCKLEKEKTQKDKYMNFTPRASLIFLHTLKSLPPPSPAHLSMHTYSLPQHGLTQCDSPALQRSAFPL